jgi:hypothetical protein
MPHTAAAAKILKELQDRNEIEGRAAGTSGTNQSCVMCDMLTRDRM